MQNLTTPPPLEHLYILKLTSFKFYVGKSTNPTERIRSHYKGTGTEWTKRFPPIDTVLCRPISSTHDEDNTTLEYMAQYGIDNVRGGSWCNVVLTPTQVEGLQRQIRHTLGLCVGCGIAGHMVTACPASQPSGNGSTRSNVTATTHALQPQLAREAVQRESPKRVTGTTSMCYNCHRRGHWAKECMSEDWVDDDSDSEDECFRCGRTGHWAIECYARTNVDGFRL